MLVTAESCTGGWAAQVVTSVAGSSAWFERGFVTYSNAAKQELLGVRPETLREHGAVSEETAREMARGALERSRGTVALVDHRGRRARPAATPAKPVGTVCFAWARGRRGALRDAPLRRRPRERAPPVGDPRARRGPATQPRRRIMGGWPPSARRPSPGCSIRATPRALAAEVDELPRRRTSAPAPRLGFPEGADRAARRLYLLRRGRGARLRRARRGARHRPARRAARAGAPRARCAASPRRASTPSPRRSAP